VPAKTPLSPPVGEPRHEPTKDDQRVHADNFDLIEAVLTQYTPKTAADHSSK
jgi:hypothetical protein